MREQTEGEKRFHKYEGERSLMDRWAKWLTHENDAGIGYPKQSALASQMERGEESGLTQYVSGPIPEGVNAVQAVSRFMFELKGSHPKVHLCLEARHRRVVGTLAIGLKPVAYIDAEGKPQYRMRGYREHEVAMVVLGAIPRAERLFRERCERGYELLRSFLGRGVKAA